MSTQWSSPSSRLMRWRVRDWVSCFLASRIPPLDDEPGRGNFGNMVREYNINDGGRSQREKYRRRKERRMVTNGEINHDGGGASGFKSTGSGEVTSSAGGEGGETTPEERELSVVDGTRTRTRRRRRYPDDDHLQEDYIVFRFGENGAFEVVKDGRHRNNRTKAVAAESNLEVVNNTGRSSCSASKPAVNRKVMNYGNQENGSRDESAAAAAAGTGRWEEKISLPTTKQQEIAGSSVKPEVLHFQQGEENYSSMRARRHPLGEIDRNQLGTTAESSSSSRDNSHSSSSASFSFPVLQWEEMVGSPVQMPKPEDNFHLRRHRMNCARFQCCRFRRNPID